MSQYEWYAVWRLGRMRKRKKMDNFKFQALRDVVKEGGDDIVEKFEKNFKVIKAEGKSVPALLYSESVPDKLPESYYTDSELKMMYMGTEYEVRKQY